MKKTFFSLIALGFVVAMATACGKKDENNNNGGNVATCPAGMTQIMVNGSTQCVYNGGNVTPNGNTGALQYKFGNQIYISDRAKFKEMLEGMGNAGTKCRTVGIFGCYSDSYSGWVCSCDMFANTGWIIIGSNQTAGGTVQIQIGGGSNSPDQWAWTSYNGYQMPVIANAAGTYFGTNNNQTFEVVAGGNSGTTSWNTQLKIRANSPNMNLPMGGRFDVEIVYRDVVIATATVQRY